jgi:hypothetical protein
LFIDKFSDYPERNQVSVSKHFSIDIRIVMKIMSENAEIQGITAVSVTMILKMAMVTGWSL